MWCRKKFSLLFLLLLYILLDSCSSNPDISPDDFYGKWEIIAIESLIDESSAPLISKNKMYFDKQLYFEFLAGNKFSTNTDLAINKLLVDSSQVNTGTYALNSTNNPVSVIIQFKDPQFKKNVSLKFRIKNRESETPELYMETEDYIQNLNAGTSQLSPEHQKALQDFSKRIIQARFSFRFRKI